MPGPGGSHLRHGAMHNPDRADAASELIVQQDRGGVSIAVPPQEMLMLSGRHPGVQRRMSLLLVAAAVHMPHRRRRARLHRGVVAPHEVAAVAGAADDTE
jgi:hypothetical protein